MIRLPAQTRWELALIAVCAFWGYTFVIIKDALERMPPFLYLGIRFTLGALALALVGGLAGLTKRELRIGAIIGVVLFAGYGFQETGLQYTSASNAGFITGLFVVLTPVVGALALRRLPSPIAAGSVVLATAGLVLLAMPDRLGLNKGDAFELLCALLFAVHILMLGRLTKGLSALRLATVQLGVTALLSTAVSVSVEQTGFDTTDGFLWFVLLVTGIGASAIAFFVQTRAQQYISPTRTAVILSAEPVFAGVAAALFAGDRIGTRGFFGALLIMIGIVAAAALGQANEDL